MLPAFSAAFRAILLLMLLVPGCSSESEAAPDPTSDTLFTSTREVRAMVVSGGELWVATSGGVVRRGADQKWRKWTQREGLPWNEVLRFAVSESGEVTAVTPRGAATWRHDQWETATAPAPAEDAVTWRHSQWRATLQGLQRKEGGKWRSVGLPPSRGTHISSLIVHHDVLWAGLFGDGLWAYDGKKWSALQVALPAAARDITALAGPAKSLPLEPGAARDHVENKSIWLGTRREGVWGYDGARWTQYLQPGEPYDHNCQYLTTFKGQLMSSSLEDGLQVRNAIGWQHIARGVLSSDAPRQLVPFGGALYIRNSPGQLDRFDGATWERNVAPHLPRGKVLGLAGDDAHLFAVQWGGWSDFDGKTWVHHTDVPELQGLPIPTFLSALDTLWLGTQSRALAELHAGGTSKGEYTVRWHDERQGLPDDWITALAHSGTDLYAGTFVGGLARYDGKVWTVAPELKGENVTALEPDGDGGLFIATRNGLWHRNSGGAMGRLNDRLKWLPTETQALCRDAAGLWVGTRTAIVFLTAASTLQATSPS